jgi:gamma-glutamylcyclotransferase
MSALPVVINFSYGSNMLWRRIRARVPSARPLGPAVLRGHRLEWHKTGRDRSGKCDVVATNDPAHVVHGVLYEFVAAEKALLDAAEGLGAGYDEKQVEVEVEGANGRVHAWLYCATATDTTLLPYSWYKALVVAGAREHALPAAYIAQLEAVIATDDDDAERHALHIALAGAG